MAEEDEGTAPDEDEAEDGRAGQSRAERLLYFPTVIVLWLLAVVPVFGNEHRVQDVDPVFMRNLVERMARYGGTYYENAIHNRGTFEPLAYDLARRLTSYDGYWFAISAMVAVMGGVVAFVAARTSRRLGANKTVALGVAVVVYLQMTMADYGWSRVLYIRNITTLLLVLVWVLAISERPWADGRHARWSSIAVGALLGCVVEQLLTTVFTGAVVGLVALALLYDRRPSEERAGHVLSAVGAAIAAFVATPLWYVARGRFNEYWEGWWEYARFMGAGPGRSLSSQLSLGWDRWYEFHRQNPLVVLMLVAFLGIIWLLWDQLDRRARILHLGLVAWWLAGWVELALSQRYSPHYYIVIGIPLILIGAALAGHACRGIAAHRPGTKVSLAVPLAAAVLGVYLTSPEIFRESVKRTTQFDGVSTLAREREKNLAGPDRSVRAVLDLVSEQDDPLLAWTFDPFVYPRFRRISATRFQWKFFMQGAIYLGRTSPEYILPDTWRWFDEDIEESHPVAFVETEVVDSGTPFDSYVRSTFREVYPGSAAKVWLRGEVADELLAPRGSGAAWTAPAGVRSGSGWEVTGDRADFAVAGLPADADGLVLSRDACTRIDLLADPGVGATLDDVQIRFASPVDPNEEVQVLALQGDKAGSGSAGLGPLGFESVPSGVNGPGPVALSIVVGRHSAALIVDGQLRAAVRLHEGVTQATLVTTMSELHVSGLQVREAPTGGGCPGPGAGSE
jgi:hypothetical protein